MMRRFRLLILLSLLALSTTGVLAHPAAATPPTRVPIDDTDQFEVTDICSFPVTIDATFVGTETTFYDQSGEVTRIQIHNVEQDVFTANGQTLTGLPFTFNLRVLFEDGEVTRLVVLSYLLHATLSCPHRLATVCRSRLCDPRSQGAAIPQLHREQLPQLLRLVPSPAALVGDHLTKR